METLPHDLRDREQWVCWRYKWIEAKDGKPGHWTKVPINAHTGTEASSTNPYTWDTLPRASAFWQRHARGAKGQRIEGIGFVLCASDPLLCLDLDHCRDPQTGTIDDWAIDTVRAWDSYTEISPSETGLHVWAKGKLPPGRRRAGHVEVYDDARYLTVTGQHLDGTPTTIEDRHDFALTWHAETFPPVPVAMPLTTQTFVPGPTSDVAELPDDQLLERASDAANGTAFDRLWRGDTSDYGGDDSAADLALCSLLRFWTGGDMARMDRLFRASGLMRPKWDERRGAQTYGEITLARATPGDVYTATRHEAFDPHEFDQDPSPPAAALEDRAECAVCAETPPASTATPGTSPPTGTTNAPARNARFARFGRDTADSWPDPLADAALWGIAGDVVRALEPHTEADRAGLLGQLLVAAANAIGPGPHVMVGQTRHSAILDAVIVGRSAHARKGDAWQAAFSVLAEAEPAWARECVTQGLSTGEGLINAVRDVSADEEFGPGRPGAPPPKERDRRLLAVETEFGRTLRVSNREGNSLSAVLRQAWDGGNLRVLTRGSSHAPSLRATAPHVGVIGHITSDELRAELTNTDSVNGFANRFLWFCVQRARRLPIPQPLDESTLAMLASRLHDALAAARRIDRVTFSPDAERLWCETYDALTDDVDGLAGAVLARGDAQTLRLAMLYALLDGSDQISTDHLLAALAVWDYCAASVVHVFGAAERDTIQQRIVESLELAGELSTDELAAALGRHVRASRREAALEALTEAGKVMYQTLPQPSGGRPRTLWRLTETGAPSLGESIYRHAQAILDALAGPVTAQTAQSAQWPEHPRQTEPHQEWGSPGEPVTAQTAHSAQPQQRGTDDASTQRTHAQPVRSDSSVAVGMAGLSERGRGRLGADDTPPLVPGVQELATELTGEWPGAGAGSGARAHEENGSVGAVPLAEVPIVQHAIPRDFYDYWTVRGDDDRAVVTRWSALLPRAYQELTAQGVAPDEATATATYLWRQNGAHG